jgi:hypothetical protein
MSEVGRSGLAAFSICAAEADVLLTRNKVAI